MDEKREQIWVTESQRRLIATAPELLEALENLAAQFDDRGKYANTHGNVLSALLDARKIIAKAKGQQS